MKKGLFLIVIIFVFYGNSYGGDGVNSNTITFETVKYSQNNKHKLCFFIEKKKEKSNNFKFAIYVPKIVAYKLRFRLKMGGKSISDEIKVKKAIFVNELLVLNIRLYEKILVPESIKNIDLFSNENKNKLVVEIISAIYK